MQNIYDSAEKLYNDIMDGVDFYKHQNIIITGSNAIGKTQLIKDILKKSLKESPNAFFYIDPKNRNMIDRGNTTFVKKLSEMSTAEILQHRLEDGVFTVLDEFAQQNSGGTVAFEELVENIEKYDEMYQSFFEISVEKIIEKDNFLSRRIVKVNGKTELSSISNSESSKMRILMEVDYAAKHGVKAIIIDEFDAYFSEESLLDFMNKLTWNYPEIRFMFVIHYLSVLVSVDGLDIALIRNAHESDIRENLVYFLDADNIEQIGQIEKIRNIMIKIKDSDEEWWEECAAMIVDGVRLGNDILNKVKEANRETLRPKEKILYDFVVRSIEKDEGLLT